MGFKNMRDKSMIAFMNKSLALVYLNKDLMVLKLIDAQEAGLVDGGVGFGKVELMFFNSQSLIASRRGEVSRHFHQLVM